MCSVKRGYAGLYFFLRSTELFLQRIYVCWRPILILFYSTTPTAWFASCVNLVRIFYETLRLNLSQIYFMNFIEPRLRRGLPLAHISGEFFRNLAIEFIADLFLPNPKNPNFQFLLIYYYTRWMCIGECWILFPI